MPSRLSPKQVLCGRRQRVPGGGGSCAGCCSSCWCRQLPEQLACLESSRCSSPRRSPWSLGRREEDGQCVVTSFPCFQSVTVGNCAKNFPVRWKSLNPFADSWLLHLVNGPWAPTRASQSSPVHSVLRCAKSCLWGPVTVSCAGTGLRMKLLPTLVSTNKPDTPFCCKTLFAGPDFLSLGEALGNRNQPGMFLESECGLI